MATSVSYDNGLYTPDSWDSLATAAVEDSTTAELETSTSAWAADATSTEDVTSPTTTSSSSTARSTSSISSSTTAASTADSTPPPSTYTTSQPAVVSSSSSPSSTPSSLPSSTATSSSSSAALASASINALSADTSSSTSSFVSMKQWLIPVIVVAPILIGLLVLGCLYGKCWGRRRQRAQEQEMGNDGGWFGGVGSLGRRRRDQRDEEGGLVEGKYAEDDAECDDFDEKAAYAGTGPPPQRTWSTMLRAGLGRGLSHSSSIRPPRRHKVPFVAVSRPSMDEPFLPPSQSHYDQAFRAVPNSQPPQAGGWNYGGRPEPTVVQPTNTGLTSGWGFGGKGSYRAKSTSSRNSSVKSRLSARLFGNPNTEEPPSPSCYSHTDGAYAGLEGEDDDPEMKEEELNEILAESRTGDSHLARRYMGGETHLADVRHAQPRQSLAQQEERYAKDRYFARHPIVPPSHHRDPSYDHLVEQMGIDLPTPPRQSHVSPTKTSAGSALLRPAMTGTPPPARLLFSYDSPPVHSTYQAPSYQPQLVSPERAPGSPRGPLPRPPQPQQPVFGNAPPPHRQLENHFDTGRPLYPAAQPGIFFSTTTQPPIGGPMPPLRQSLPQSNSIYSLSGVRDLVFGTGGEEPQMMGQQQQQGAPKQRPSSPTKEGASAKLKKTNPNPPQYPSMQDERPIVPPRNPSREWDRAELASFGSAPPAPPPQPQQEPSFNPVFSDSAPLPPLQHPSRVRNAIHNLEAAVASSGSPPPSPTKRSTSPYRPLSGTTPSASTPSPQRVIRSHTTYQRPMKSGSDSDDEDRISSDKLQRSRTSDSMAARPLSSDPRRLSQMLRRPSAGGGLARPVMLDSEE
ncbi:hypothetical protein BCR35DRAFT_308865 [Leucosporidium creatinivorum]|uniref:Proteophosphoglycan ppg4 n=1 Tax=Leucosporidium creatinivorum TaxID=106004 RepID=A0A1Y2DUL3_9BASI|nr:hypothetical protein BCR35DRAFT_308865 [Leucosporidium creatinivorum]